MTAQDPEVLERILAGEPLLTPAEVAKIFRVDPKTVTRWAAAGRLDCVRTPGGHRRYLKSDILALATGGAL